MTAEPLLRIRGLTVSYPGVGREILTGVDLDAPAGATVAVLGPSGAGKSTLVVAIAGLLPPDTRVSGEIWFDGVALHDLDERARRRLRGRHIAIIPQDPTVALNPVLPIGVQVAEALLVHGMAGRAKAARRAVELLRSAGLPDPETVAVRYPHNLSGGMRQRALVACALAAEPRLVLADEPTSAVDAVSQAGVLDDLASVTTGTGRTLILVTHDIGLAMERADWGVVLDRGRTVEAGPIGRLASAPEHPVTRALVAAAPHSRTARLRPRARPATSGTAPDPVRGRPLLRLERVSVVYRPTLRRTEPVRALVEVDAEVRRGETLGVVGESGAGKSTLAALALRLVTPTAGRVLFDGAEVTGLRGAALRSFRRRAQLVFQDAYAALNPQMRVGTAIAEPLRALRLANRADRRIRVREAADLVGLPTSILERRPRELSGGECQRVVLARALVLRPDLLICDEPASALDAAMQAQVLQLLVDVQGELDLGYLFISHDLAAVRQVADRVMVLREGRVVEQGVASEVLEHPAHPYTAALVTATPGHRAAPKLPMHHASSGGTSAMSVNPRAASPVDFEQFGPYLPKNRAGEPLQRSEPAFRARITADGSSGHPAEPGRYHLYVAAPCPFSHRSTIVLHLKGLQDVVTVSVADPLRDGRGWAFREGPGHGLDEVNGFAFLSEAYQATDADYDSHVSVPALWDRQSGRIVCNDYRVLSTDLATAFDKYATNDIDLYPEDLRSEIDELHEFLYTRVHDGPYRCGFARGQEVYEHEVAQLFEALDQLDERLRDQRYLFGDRLTEADIRLYVTLARFDTVYFTHFKANLRRIADYPRLSTYFRDLYQLPAFRDTTDFGQIKNHYFRTHPWLNPTGIVPVGPALDDLLGG